jgi:hypothetical protein
LLEQLRGTPGQMRFYGFAFYLPANWQFVSKRLVESDK